MASYTTPVTNFRTGHGENDIVPTADFKLFDAAYDWSKEYNVYPVKGGLMDMSASLTHPATVPGDATSLFLLRKAAGNVN